MRFLITGGAGFIGRHLLRLLLEAGHHVRVLDDFSTGSRLAFPESVEVIEGDACDSDVARAVLAGIDGVFHLAAIPSVMVSETDPLKNQRSGEVALLSILSAALDAPSVKRIVFASSAAVYGDAPDLPISETAEVFPRSNYGVSKLSAEHYLRAACARQDHLDAACLRLFNVYGPGQRPDSSYAGVITRFLTCLAENRPVTIYGNGDQTRDFVWVGDVARACLLAMLAPGRLAGRAINIGSGAGSSINDVWNVISAVSQTTQTPLRASGRPAEIRDSRADVSLARELLGFQTRVPLADGIARLIAGN